MTTRPRQYAETAVPERQMLLTGRGMLVVFRDPVKPPIPAPGQPGVHSYWQPTEPELFLVLMADGRVLAFNGHVDLGTGIRTALAQIVAEELDFPPDRITMVLGHTREAPNQGPTIASASIQVSAVPLRAAAAQARRWLIEQAAAHTGMSAADLALTNGRIVACNAATAKAPSLPSVTDLIAGQRIELRLDAHTPVKPHRDYRLIGQTMPRVDIPAKVTGQLTYVQDVRLDGMLHGRVVRPPWTGRDRGEFVGQSLIGVDRSSIAHLPGIVAVVVLGDFVGIVAEREEQAIRAASELAVEWRAPPPLPDFSDLGGLLLSRPANHRPLLTEGDVDGAISEYGTPARTYVWPYQMHGSIGPSCSVARFDPDGEPVLSVWSGTQNPHSLRADLAALLDIEEGDIEIHRMETAGCYGRNCADDVGADAALLSRAVGQPVRVQLSRAQEHGWEPKGSAQVMSVRGALAPDGRVAAYDFSTRYPSDDAPTLALLLTGVKTAGDVPFQMGDRTAVPPYTIPARRIACDDLHPIVRASWFRGVSALPNTFAHESWIDEAAFLANADPLAFRLRHLDDERARDTLRQASERLHWPHRRAATHIDPAASVLRGRGLAYARYVHSKFPGFGAAMAAWAIELSVAPQTGRITIERIVVSQDAGLMINPAGVRHQVHGNVIQTLSRTLKECVSFDHQSVTALEWGAYPLITFEEIPDIELVLLDRPEAAPLGVGESSSLPGAPAIANALFDATGIRFRQAPFTPDIIRNAIAERGLGSDAHAPTRDTTAPHPATMKRTRMQPSNR